MARDRLRGREVRLRFRLPDIAVAREEDAAAHDEIPRQRETPVVRLLCPENVGRRLTATRPERHQVVHDVPRARGGGEALLLRG